MHDVRHDQTGVRIVITILGFTVLISFFSYVALVDSYGPGPCNQARLTTQSARTCARKV